jgi:hypothetical protein
MSSNELPLGHPSDKIDADECVVPDAEGDIALEDASLRVFCRPEYAMPISRCLRMK